MANQMAKILLVEDEVNIASFIERGLKFGHEVSVAYDGMAGWELLQKENFQFLILDIIMPRMNGLQLCRQYRQLYGYQSPVIMLTALGTTDDIVNGLDAGADDYLGKPFDTRELLARLRALTRRPGTTAESAIRCGDVTLDAAQLTLSGPKAAAALTKREADLLEVLLRTPGQLQTRAVLLARVWGPLAEVEDANLDCYIHFVRRRLKAVGSAVTITTVRGSGYKAEVPPC